jgi:hypothetical protein
MAGQVTSILSRCWKLWCLLIACAVKQMPQQELGFSDNDAAVSDFVFPAIAEHSYMCFFHPGACPLQCEKKKELCLQENTLI